MRINNIIGYKRVSKIAAVSVIVFALALTIALSARAESRGMAASTPGNLAYEKAPKANLIDYGKESFVIPDDVDYSDEGRPYSATYDYRDTPILKDMADTLESNGFVISDPEVEYLDREGNTKTGRELYAFNAIKSDSNHILSVSIYMVSESYADDMLDQMQERDGLWIYENPDGKEQGWYVYRIYDPSTGMMMDASGNIPFDWESLGLF